MILTNKHVQTTNQRKNKNNLKESTMRNNKGFTLIELIMVTIILGILAAVAIPRYMESVKQAEMAAEDAVINAIRAGLEQHATEKLMANGRRSWPDNPWDALETKPAGYATADEDAGDDGEWRFNTTTANITHMRANGTVVHWDYTKGTNSGGNTDAVGDLTTRGEDADGDTHESN
tara:strand:- start:828 stop:1355 length:528 start_codon:yes stop_codon:yes gene_type:complete